MNIFELLRESGVPCSFSIGGTICSADDERLHFFRQIPIHDIIYDSRRAAPNTVFLCLPGVRADGHAYAPTVYDSGCRLFFAEHTLALPPDALVILVPDTRAALPFLSDALFGHPQKELTVIGITGTKGKTTIVNLIAQCLNAAGISCGTIGTIGITYNGKWFPTVNSTPESYVLHKTFREMADQNVKVVVMEVSSLALCRHRVDGIQFDIAAFTNLSEDHISEIEHPDFTHYKTSKMKLFSMCDYAVMTEDGAYAAEFQQSCQCPYVTFGLNDTAAFHAFDIKPWKHDTALGITFAIREKTMEQERQKKTASHAAIAQETVTLRIPGTFNAQNALCVIAILRKLGLAYKDFLLPLSKATVPGRFEILDVLDYCTVVLDYAHNEMSMRSLLETVRAYHPKRIITLYGSIGGRAQNRRRELACVTGDLSDYAVITSDNPDYEDPNAITAEIASYYTDDMCPHTVITDRKEAIFYVLEMAKPGDILLFCGKGHETYQIIRGVHVPFSEKAIIEETCAAMRRQDTAAAILQNI